MLTKLIPTNNKLSNSLSIIGSIVLISILVFVTINRNKGIFWDEALYFRDIIALEKLGLSAQFLNSLYGPAGPLYALVHYALSPLTELEATSMRLVNVSLLVGIVLLTALTLKQLEFSHPITASLTILAIPMIYVCSGMALTEMPAMFFCTVAIFFLFKSITISSFTKACIFSILGGIALGFAIIGRQPYLVVLGALPALFLPNFQFANPVFKRVLIFGLVALILPLIVFFIWGGIQPMASFTASTSKGLAPFHAILAFGYGGAVILLIAPQWFMKPKVSQVGWLLLVLVIMLCVNYFILQYEFTPMKSVATRFLPTGVVTIYSRACPALLTFFALYFIASTLFNVLQRGNTPYFSFFTFATLLILLTTIKVTHQFSSRYVAQATPFIALMLAPYEKQNLAKVIRMILGACLGLMMLQSFFDSNSV